MGSPFNPFIIKANKFLVLQVNDSCMSFISHNPCIYFYVGLVSEKENFFATCDAIYSTVQPVNHESIIFRFN